jgi:hypothetical protein
MIIKLADKDSFLISSIIILLIALSLIQPVKAEENNEGDDRYDGSEFNASSFEDTNFRKTDYRDLRSTNPAAAQLVKENSESLTKGGNRLMHKHRESNGVPEVGNSTDKGPIKNPDGRVIDKERSGPVRDLPGDWVPDKLDPVSNGGFEISPENGAPVPYRLNGHVDIQRGRP